MDWKPLWGLREGPIESPFPVGKGQGQEGLAHTLTSGAF